MKQSRSIWEAGLQGKCQYTTFETGTIHRVKTLVFFILFLVFEDGFLFLLFGIVHETEALLYEEYGKLYFLTANCCFCDLILECFGLWWSLMS